MRVWMERALVFFVLLVAVAGGCAILERLGFLPQGSVFSHAKHGSEQELSCTDCHKGAESADKAGLPKLSQCKLCHEDSGEHPEADLKALSLFADGKLQARHFTTLSEDALFSHQKHAEANVSCEKCHGDVAHAKRLTAEVHVAKEKCFGCHAQAQIDNGRCQTCHTEIGKEWKPPSHEMNWKKLHGQLVRAESEEILNQCSLCHTEASCNACHQEEEPASHTAFFRTKGHGMAAGMDRETCATCHRQESCNTCHLESAPRTHMGSWGDMGVPAARDQHCFSCHDSGGSPSLSPDNQCFVCHKGTPSHSLATPKPSTPDHSPAFNCRQCHLAGNVPPSPVLPHVDDGSNCNACHQ